MLHTTNALPVFASLLYSQTLICNTPCFCTTLLCICIAVYLLALKPKSWFAGHPGGNKSKGYLPTFALPRCPMLQDTEMQAVVQFPDIKP
jgi:hypothetical protein